MDGRIQDHTQNSVLGGAFIIFFSKGDRHPLGPKNPLETKDFTNPGRGLSSHSSPPEYASTSIKPDILVFNSSAP